MGPVFPDTPHHDRKIPVPRRGERTSAGGPRKSLFQDVSFLLQNFEGLCYKMSAVSALSKNIAKDTNQ